MKTTLAVMIAVLFFLPGLSITIAEPDSYKSASPACPWGERGGGMDLLLTRGGENYYHSSAVVAVASLLDECPTRPLPMVAQAPAPEGEGRILTSAPAVGTQSPAGSGPEQPLAKQLTYLGFPLPADTRIAPAEADTPPELARLPRIWIGFWIYSLPLPHLLVIERIRSGGAEVVYCWGPYTPGGIDRAKCERFSMRFVNGELMSMHQDPYLSYKQKDGKLVGIYRRRSSEAAGVFSEVRLGQQ